MSINKVRDYMLVLVVIAVIIAVIIILAKIVIHNMDKFNSTQNISSNMLYYPQQYRNAAIGLGEYAQYQ